MLNFSSINFMLPLAIISLPAVGFVTGHLSNQTENVIPDEDIDSLFDYDQHFFPTSKPILSRLARSISNPIQSNPIQSNSVKLPSTRYVNGFSKLPKQEQKNIHEYYAILKQNSIQGRHSYRDSIDSDGNWLSWQINPGIGPKDNKQNPIYLRANISSIANNVNLVNESGTHAYCFRFSWIRRASNYVDQLNNAGSKFPTS